MTQTRKHVLVPIACILGGAFAAGMIMSLVLANQHSHGPVFRQLLLGTVGPFIVLLFLPTIIPVVWTVLFGLSVTATVVGVAKRRLALAMAGSVPMALLWLVGIYFACWLSNMD
jgi:hypothetical protein